MCIIVVGLAYRTSFDVMLSATMPGASSDLSVKLAAVLPAGALSPREGEVTTSVPVADAMSTTLLLLNDRLIVKAKGKLGVKDTVMDGETVAVGMYSVLVALSHCTNVFVVGAALELDTNVLPCTVNTTLLLAVRAL
jgi:hypothetical protein